MRLVSYNILEGGEGRADPLAEVILAQRADIVALVEADNPAVLERIAHRLAMDFIHAPAGKHASALLTRWTLRESINHAAMTDKLSKSLLEAVVVDPAGIEWTIGVVHLAAHAREEDEAKREKELKFVLERFAPHRRDKRPHILCGDFNANAAYQQIDPEKVKPSTRKEWAENGGQLPRRVVQRLLDAGYLDSLYVVNPALASTAGTFSTQFPGQRVDYIFTWGYPKAAHRDAWIETDRLAKYASDHFPIGAEIG
jgi:endonuclease/exonuclease/phosphatase family metal-dependent hydrolase